MCMQAASAVRSQRLVQFAALCLPLADGLSRETGEAAYHTACPWAENTGALFGHCGYCLGLMVLVCFGDCLFVSFSIRVSSSVGDIVIVCRRV